MRTFYIIVIVLFLKQLGFSQVLKIYREGIDITASTITINGNALDAELVANKIVIINTIQAELDVKVKRYEVSFTSNTFNYMCWGILCGNPRLAGSSPFYIHGDIVALADSNKSFSGHYLPEGQVGQSIYRYVFFTTNNSDSAYCDVIYNAINAISVKELENEENINIYPSVTSSHFTIEFKSAKSLFADISVYNQLGELVLKDRKNMKSNENNKLIVSTESLQDGFYTVYVTANKKVIMRKIVVNRY